MSQLPLGELALPWPPCLYGLCLDPLVPVAPAHCSAKLPHSLDFGTQKGAACHT